MKIGVAVVFLLCLSAAFAQSEAEFNKEVDIYVETEDRFCWRDSYGRGVGVIPKDCGPDKEYDAGLCYVRCNDGYKGVGPVCWNFPKSYGRGVGTVPKSCQNGMQYDAGLCYKHCNSGYKGVGPVCWKSCTAFTPVSCGAACATSSDACIKGVFKLIKSVLNMIKDLAELIKNQGGQPADNTSNEKAMQSTFQLAKKFIEKGYSKEAFINFMKKKGLKVGVKVSAITLSMIYDKASIKDIIKLDLEIISQYDSTGISRVILAFLEDSC
jgi:hypothetical protein